MDRARPSDDLRWRRALLPAAREPLFTALEHLARFPVLDATVIRVLAIVDDPESTTADLVAVLEVDATFAANLLRLANSAAMAQPIRAKTVRQAVMLIGRRALRRLALETATFRFFERAPGAPRQLRGELHLHAVSTASVAAAAAEAMRLPTEIAHLAGLLHDIGRLVLPLAFGEPACDAVARHAADGAERTTAEHDAFGVDHAVAGALLAELWNIDAAVVGALAWHHGGPTGVASPDAMSACVQLADQVAHLADDGTADHALVEVALERAGLAPTVLDALAGHAVPARAAGGEPGALARRATEVERLSQTDELTGVDTRRHWLQASRAALAAERPGAGAAVLCAIDGLPPVGRAGLRATDDALTAVGRAVAAHGDGGRLAAGTFAVWLHGGSGAASEAAARIGAEAAAALARCPDVDGLTLRVGTASVADHGSDLALVLEAAQDALRACSPIVPSAAAELSAVAAPDPCGPPAASSGRFRGGLSALLSRTG